MRNSKTARVIWCSGAVLLGVVLMIDEAHANGNVHVSRFWHNHQPLYWPEWNSNGSQTQRGQYAWDSITLKPTQNYGGTSPKVHPENNLTDIFGLDDRRSAYQSRPSDSLGTFSGGGFALSYSGSLIDNVRQLASVNQLGYAPGWNSGNTSRRTQGRLDLVGFTYHHSLAPLLPKEVFRKEMQIFKEAWWKAWGGNSDKSDHTKGFFPTEMAYSRHMIDVLVDEGYEWLIVASHHISRTSPGYNNVANPQGSYQIKSSPPNKADQLSPNFDSGWWFLEPNPGNAAWNVAPFAYQLHKVKYVNPSNGTEKLMVAVPSDDALSYRYGYANEGIGKIQANISPFANDPARPVIVMPSTDGDNAWGGGFSSWMEATPQFFNESASAGYVKNTPGGFVNAHKNAAPVTHIEDGAWIFPESDYGSPYFLKWIEPPLGTKGSVSNYPGTFADLEAPGFALKFFSYAPLMAGANYVITAEQMWKDQGGQVRPWVIQAPYDWDGNGFSDRNIIERAWHIYLKGLDSGFNYYGGLGNDDEVKPGLATKRATDLLENYISTNLVNDRTEPTVLKPQRFPYNPGWYTFGWFNAFGTGTNNQYLKRMPSEFYIWTHAFDVSGVSSVNLKIRIDSDGVNAMANNHNELYAGGSDVGTWITIPMTKRVLPNTRAALNAKAASGEIDYFVFDPSFWPNPKIADYYFAKITDNNVAGFRGKLLDYYIEATDTRSNVHKSEIQHVWVENDGGTSSNPSTTTFSADPSDCAPLTVTYTANQGSLSNATPVKMQISFNQASNFTAYTMNSLGGGVHSFTVTNVPDNAPGAIVYFQNSAETITDNRNGLNWSTSIRDCDAPVGPGTANFTTAPACQPVTIDYRQNSGVLAIATQVYAHIGFNNWQSVVASQPMTKISNNLWRIQIQPQTNATQLDLVFNNGAIWDNNNSADWHFPLNVCLGPTPPSGFSVTNPVSGSTNNSLTVNLQGIGESVSGDLRWTNTLTGLSGTSLGGLFWTIGDIPLGIGTNIITVIGTNQLPGGVVTNAHDSGSSALYGDGWDASENAGFGFGGWQLYTSTTNSGNAGRFMANSAAVNIGVPAWGLYANNGQLSEAKRYLTEPLSTSQTFYVSFDNGFIDAGAGTGVALQNLAGQTLWEFFFNGGDTNYSISGSTTDIGFTAGGLEVQFNLSGPTSYIARITPLGGPQRTISGNLNANADSSIQLFRAWNNFAGSNSERDVFFNNLKVTGIGSGQAVVTSATVVIVREGSTVDSNSDGIPDAWCQQYGLNPNTPGLADQQIPGGGGATYFEAFIHDINPTNPIPANFNRTLANGILGDIMGLTIDPTSTGRLYDVLWTTNLLGGWTNYGFNQPGNGGLLILPVTNAAEPRYYRTGVKLP